jgi:hypothetical protein
MNHHKLTIDKKCFRKKPIRHGVALTNENRTPTAKLRSPQIYDSGLTRERMHGHWYPRALDWSVYGLLDR